MNYSTKILLNLTSIALLINYVETMVVPALPTIQEEFATTSSLAAWVTSAFIIVGAITSPIFGKLGDMFGKKKMYLISMLFYILSVGLAGFSYSIYFLIFARAIQGIGFAMFPISLAIITDVFPKEKVAAAQGIISGMIGIGTALGLIIGSYIDQYLGWRFAFHTAFIISIILVLVSYYIIKEDEKRQRGKIDYIGASTLVSGISLILIYLTEGPYLGWYTFEELLFLILGLFLTIFFFYYESKREYDQLISIDLLRIRNFMVANIVGLLSGISLFLMFFMVIYYSQLPKPYGLGLDIVSAGLTLAPATIVMLVIGPIVGRLTSKIGPKPILSIGSLISILGFYLLIVNRTDPYQLTEDLLIAGSGIISLIIPIVNMVAITVPEEARAVSLGMNTLIRNLGASIGPVVASVYMASYQTPVILFYGNTILNVSFIPSNTSFNLMMLTAIMITVLIFLIVVVYAKNYVFKQGVYTLT
jgi:EmrB/QacA subfamily drug resistance transporter